MGTLVWDRTHSSATAILGTVQEVSVTDVCCIAAMTSNDIWLSVPEVSNIS